MRTHDQPQIICKSDTIINQTTEMNLVSELQKNEILGGKYYKIEYYFLLSLRQEIDLFWKRASSHYYVYVSNYYEIVAAKQKFLFVVFFFYLELLSKLV